MTDHAFKPNPWPNRDICDAKIAEEDGRARTCALPKSEHTETDLALLVRFVVALRAAFDARLSEETKDILAADLGPRFSAEESDRLERLCAKPNTPRMANEGHAAPQSTAGASGADDGGSSAPHGASDGIAGSARCTSTYEGNRCILNPHEGEHIARFGDLDCVWFDTSAADISGAGETHESIIVGEE